MTIRFVGAGLLVEFVLPVRLRYGRNCRCCLGLFRLPSPGMIWLSQFAGGTASPSLAILAARVPTECWSASVALYSVGFSPGGVWLQTPGSGHILVFCLFCLLRFAAKRPNSHFVFRPLQQLFATAASPLATPTYEDRQFEGFVWYLANQVALIGAGSWDDGIPCA